MGLSLPNVNFLLTSLETSTCQHVLLREWHILSLYCITTELQSITGDFSDDKSNFQNDDLSSFMPNTGITAVEFFRTGLAT